MRNHVKMSRSAAADTGHIPTLSVGTFSTDARGQHFQTHIAQREMLRAQSLLLIDIEKNTEQKDLIFAFFNNQRKSLSQSLQ